LATEQVCGFSKKSTSIAQLCTEEGSDKGFSAPHEDTFQQPQES